MNVGLIKRLLELVYTVLAAWPKHTPPMPCTLAPTEMFQIQNLDSEDGWGTLLRVVLNLLSQVCLSAYWRQIQNIFTSELLILECVC